MLGVFLGTDRGRQKFLDELRADGDPPGDVT
jgi:hypothetical protein